MTGHLSFDRWFLLESGPGPADFNMALDEALLIHAPDLGSPVLRFYGWRQPAASFGYSQKYIDIVRATLLRPLVRRPTGGGLVPHDADWTYSLVFPPAHEWYQLRAVDSYQRVHEWICGAFARMDVPATLAPCCQKEIPGQCFAGAEKFDVLWRGKKIAGAAQRRTRTGLLIQGSIQPPPMGLNRADWQAAMRETAGVQWKVLELNKKLAAAIERLKSVKYGQPSYNERR